MTPPDGSPCSSDAEIDVDDLDIVVCDEMETVDSDEQESAIDPLDAEQIEYFTPPRDDAIAVLQGHKESVFCVTVDPTGTFLASGGQDHVAIVWDVATGQIVFKTEGHEDSVTCVTFSPDGKYLATGDMAGGVRVWLRPNSGASLSDSWTLLMSNSVGDLHWLRWWQPASAKSLTGAAASHEGPGLAVLAAGDEDGLISVWSVNAPTTRSSRSASKNKVKYFASAGFAAIDGAFYVPSIDTDRPKLTALYKDGVLRLWDLKSEEVMTSIRLVGAPHHHHHHIESDGPSNDELAGSEQHVFCLAQPHPGTDSIYQQQTDLIVVGGIDCLHMAVVNQDKQNGSFTSKLLPSIQVEGCGSVEVVDFSWTHPFFAFGTVSGTICIVDTVRMRVRQKWTYHDTNNDVGITSLLWSQTCPLFYTSASNGAVLAWHGLSGAAELAAQGVPSEPAPLRIWWGHRAMVLDTALPPATTADLDDASQNKNNKLRLFERFVVSASDDATVRVYSTQDVLSNLSEC